MSAKLRAKDLSPYPIEHIYARFGARVAVFRTRMFLTQEKLSSKVGLTRTSIVNIENGNQRILLNDVWRFSRALKCTPQVLMRGVW